MAIIHQIEKGVIKAGKKNYSIFPDRREAIKQALALSQEGDYILLAGKGHEDYQIIGDEVIPFSDSEVIQDLLKEMRQP
jgi:UDP-N-acetylmuramoyl-L-alanyl-D-glutamate--2,6-diaminopimelate ligase